MAKHQNHVRQKYGDCEVISDMIRLVFEATDGYGGKEGCELCCMRKL